VGTPPLLLRVRRFAIPRLVLQKGCLGRRVGWSVLACIGGIYDALALDKSRAASARKLLHFVVKNGLTIVLGYGTRLRM
jgi:hypothetical protein